MPFGVWTDRRPELAPQGTIAEIRVFEITLKMAEVPWKATLVVPRNPVPVMITLTPIGPFFGEKPLNETVLAAVWMCGATDRAAAACAQGLGAINKTHTAAKAVDVNILLTVGSLRVVARSPFARLSSDPLTGKGE